MPILGNDIPVKETYANIISSNLRPDVFCDIGANYGSHSLLFLCHGIRTISFEPNLACMERFQQLCDANHVNPLIELCALSDKPGSANLHFPERDTWLGTILAPSTEVATKTIEVPLNTLDSYIGELRGKRVLVKIDAEGAEDKILVGAHRVIAECRPHIIFECWDDKNFRMPLYNFLIGNDYRIFPLPWTPDSGGSISEMDFCASHHTNFIAVPN